MLTLLALALVSHQSEIHELPVPKGCEMGGLIAVGPQGQVVFDAYRNDENIQFLWDGKKAVELKPGAKFGMDEDLASGIVVNGFLANGEFYGARVFMYSGASTMTYFKPFVTKNKVMMPAKVPATMEKWEELSVFAVKPDGSILLNGIAEGTHPFMGDDKIAIERSYWVKDGRAIQDLGPSSHPILAPDGTVYATQYLDQDNEPAREGLFRAKAQAGVIKDGRFSRIIDGAVVAAFSDGQILISQDQLSENENSNVPDSTQFFICGKDKEVRLTPLTQGSELLDAALISPRQGIFKIYDGVDVRARVFEGSTYKDLEIPSGAGTVEVVLASDTAFAVWTSVFDSGDSHIYVGHF